jgi:hypothetical protein
MPCFIALCQYSSKATDRFRKVRENLASGQKLNQSEFLMFAEEIEKRIHIPEAEPVCLFPCVTITTHKACHVSTENFVLFVHCFQKN